MHLRRDRTRFADLTTEGRNLSHQQPHQLGSTGLGMRGVQLNHGEPCRHARRQRGTQSLPMAGKRNRGQKGPVHQVIKSDGIIRQIDDLDINVAGQKLVCESAHALIDDERNHGIEALPPKGCSTSSPAELSTELSLQLKGESVSDAKVASARRVRTSGRARLMVVQRLVTSRVVVELSVASGFRGGVGLLGPPEPRSRTMTKPMMDLRALRQKPDQ